jgi:uncharacterized protein DUF6046
MAVVDLDLVDLYRQAFGEETTAFNPDLKPVMGDTSLSRVTQGLIAGSPYYATDPVLNQEYFMPVTITYPDLSPVSAQDAGLLGSNSLGILKTWNPPFPFITIGAKKIIIETPLTERSGTVKELIQLKDYDITIRGFIIADTNDYPEAGVTTLRDVYEANVAIGIKCPATDIWLIRPGVNAQVVILDMKLPGLKGVKNVVPYELTLVSDQPFNLIDIS